MPQIPGSLLLSAVPTTTVTLERYAEPTSVNAYGEPQVAAPSSSSVEMVVHQATRKQLDRAGLDHALDWHAFVSPVELRTVHNGRPDVIETPDGERWELHDVGHYETIAGVWLALGRRLET